MSEAEWPSDRWYVKLVLITPFAIYAGVLGAIAFLFITGGGCS